MRISLPILLCATAAVVFTSPAYSQQSSPSGRVCSWGLPAASQRSRSCLWPKFLAWNGISEQTQIGAPIRTLRRSWEARRSCA